MGRLKHLQQGLRSFGHFPNTKISRANDVYGFGGAEYWWDAAVGLNTSTDLGAVSYWDDRISGARWAQGTAGSQPRLQLTSAIKNTFPSINFFDTARQMKPIITGFPMMGKTIAFVAKVNIINVFCNGVIGNEAVSTQQGIIMAGNNALITGIGVYTSTNAIAASTIENLNAHIIVVTTSGVIVDGVIAATGNIILPNADVIGNSISAGSNTKLLGEIGEILIYNRNLTNAQGVELCNNLNAKWAIY